MTWFGSTGSGIPTGGHLDEQPEIVRAVHFGCNRRGSLGLTPEMLGSESARWWFEGHVAYLWSTALRMGIASVLD
jgi:hypothetical protein